MVKNLSAVWENWVQSLGWEDPMEEGMATHSSILAWRILWRKHYSSFSVMPRHRESLNTSHLQMSDRKKKNLRKKGLISRSNYYSILNNSTYLLVGHFLWSNRKFKMCKTKTLPSKKRSR